MLNVRKPCSQLELSEVRGQLRGEKAAAEQTRSRVEALSAQLAHVHDGQAIGMTWQNAQASCQAHLLHSKWVS